MRFFAFFVHRWQLSVLLLLMLAAFGVNGFLSIPRSEDPVLDYPAATVAVIYPGASPGDIEQQAVKPLEDRILSLDHLKKVTSYSKDGLGYLGIEFDADQDAVKKYDEVLREVNEVRADLPADLVTLKVFRAGPNYVNIVQVALVSEGASYALLEDRATAIRDRIERVPGVLHSETWGYPARQVTVALDLGRLAQVRVPPSQVLAAIGSDNLEIPAGSVDVGRRRFNVNTGGAYETIEQVRGTVVGGAAGRAILLGDVADVEWGYADPRHVARYNGRRAVWVTANQDGTRNIQDVRDDIYRALDELQRTLPPSITLERGFDQSLNVAKRMRQLGRDFTLAVLIVLVTLLPLGVRGSAVVMTAIPLSVAMGLAVLQLTGFTLNQISIVGFVIALGLLVDDSIVVAENIARFMREGHERRDAAVRATRQIALAVLGSTATLVFAFVPLAFLPGGAGMFIRGLPLAVIYTVLASLLVALTIVPWLSSALLREHRPDGNVFMRGLRRGIQLTYAPLLRWVLQWPRATLVGTAVLIVASVALLPVVGFSLFPKAGTPQFLVRVETPEGSSLAETDSAVRFVERTLARHPQVKQIFANVGRDNPQIYYNAFPRQENSTVGQAFVLLDRYEGGARGTEALLDSIRGQLTAYPNAKIKLVEFENGPPIVAPIDLRITGPNLDTLRTLAAQVEAVLRRVDGTQYVDNPLRGRRTDLEVVVDRRKAGLLGVPTAEVDRTVRLGIAGLSAGRFRESDGDERDITVRLPHRGLPDAGALDRVYLASASGSLVPLRQVADVRFVSSPSAIAHYDGQRVSSVSSYVRTGWNTDRVTKATLRELESVRLPDGYTITPGGEIESRQESFGGVGTAIIIAVFAILAVLVLEFGSFRSTLIVATVIPLGILGGIVALWATGYTLSFAATIGFVALVGIEIKTSILLVDFTNQLRAQGVALDEAVQRAGEIRFVPIVLTSATAVGGLLPLAVQGSELYSPLAWVVIGGLVSSTLLARLVTPVVYKLIPPDIDR